MKLFYIVMLTALIGFFGIGCEEGPEPGTPVEDPATTPTEQQFFTVYSQLITVVSVKSDAVSIDLNVGDCIAVPQDKWAGLEISAGDRKLCGGSEEGDVACEAKNIKVTRSDEDNSIIFIDSNVLGCTSVLEEKKEDGEEEGDAGEDGDGAADAGAADASADGGDAS